MTDANRTTDGKDLTIEQTRPGDFYLLVPRCLINDDSESDDAGSPLLREMMRMMERNGCRFVDWGEDHDTHIEMWFVVDDALRQFEPTPPEPRGEQDLSLALTHCRAGRRYAEIHCPNLVGDFDAIEMALRSCEPCGEQWPAGVFEATKRPVTIKTIQWTGTNLRDVIAFTGRHESAKDWTWDYFEDLVKREGLKIFTLEGSHMATVGDFIIRGVHGEFYPCKPDIFAKTYTTEPREPAEKQNSSGSDSRPVGMPVLAAGASLPADAAPLEAGTAHQPRTDATEMLVGWLDPEDGSLIGTPGREYGGNVILPAQPEWIPLYARLSITKLEKRL